MACAAKFGVMLALASAAMAAPIDRGLDTRSPARPPMVSPDDHPRSARAAIGVCLGDRATFNPFPHWGTVCSSYAEGGTNRDYCNDDKDADGRSAAEVCFECGACRPNYPAGTKMHHNDGAQCQSGNAGLWNDQKDGHVTYCCRTGKNLNNWAKGWCADMENNDRCIFDGQCKSGYCRNGMSRNGVCGTPPPPPQPSTPPPPSYLAPGTHCDTRPNHHPSCNKCKNAHWVYSTNPFDWRGTTRCCSGTLSKLGCR